MTTAARLPREDRSGIHEVESGYNAETIRADFPILNQQVHGHQLV